MKLEFDPAAVKHGNTTDPDKRRAKEDSDRLKFAATQAAARKKIACEETDQWDTFVDRAALDATTGRVLAIGLQSASRNGPKSKPVILSGDEREVLEDFWRLFCDCRDTTGGELVGFNSDGFDLPFMVRRSWALGVYVPHDLMNGRYFNRVFIDLMKVWQCGDSRRYISLDKVCQFLDLARKTGDGADFHRLWNGPDEEHQQAVEYLENDLLMTLEVARQMGAA